MRYFGLVKWSYLKVFSESGLSKALLFISLTPLINAYLKLVRIINLNSIPLRLSVGGALLFLLSVFLVRITMPEHIYHHRNKNNFHDRLIKIAEKIDFEIFFQAMPHCLILYGKILNDIELKYVTALMPPSEAVERLGHDKAASVLSFCFYELLDVSRPTLRLCISIIMLISATVMCSTIIMSILSIMRILG